MLMRLKLKNRYAKKLTLKLPLDLRSVVCNPAGPVIGTTQPPPVRMP